MGSYVDAHASTLVNHCLDIETGTNVVVQAPPCAEDLVKGLARRVGERGANLVWKSESSRVFREYLCGLSQNQVSQTDHLLALMEAADACIYVKGSPNLATTSDVPSETFDAFMKAQQQVHEASKAGQWVVTQYPATGNAQRAGMSESAYRQFVSRAVSVDWEAQRRRQSEIVAFLDSAEQLRIVGDETDLTMSIAGNTALGDCGKQNLPGGEVFTAPCKHSVDGQIHFDVPFRHNGQEVSDVTLHFKDGRVIDYSATKNEPVLASVLNADRGAQYVGEIGFGTNETIDQVTYNDLFDEKMGRTIHLALGSAYPETVGSANEMNESSEHVDLIADASDGLQVEVDGDVIYCGGEFDLDR